MNQHRKSGAMSDASREKVLLSLKWFVQRLLRSFEQKLESAIFRIRSPHSQSLSFVDCDSCNACSYSLSGYCAVHLSRSKHSPGTSSESVNKQPILSPKPKSSVSNESSPLMRMRSLTNSPIFRRISMHFLPQLNKAIDIDCGEKNEILNGQSRPHPSTAAIRSPSLYSRNLHMQYTLINFYSNSTKDERNAELLKFAQNLSVVYEYQLGMLQGLKAIHAAADYIADFLLKAIQLEKITDFSTDQLTPALLYNQECRPKNYSKCVKTCALPVTCEQLTWRLGEMWTLSGVRHNEVGGENCHNLSIVTHFIVADAGPKECTRSDLYGYRNLILLPRLEQVDHRECSQQNPMEHCSGPDNSQTNGVPIDYTTRNSYYELCQHDHNLLKNSKVNTGSREENYRQKREKPPTTNRKDEGLKKSGGDSPRDSQRTPTRNTVMNSASTIRQHLHRAYRPVFFVIFNRPNVIEHLIECDSFAAFCKRQSLSPVMFLNEPTSTYDTRSYPCIYQNFNIFNVTVSGYMKNSNMSLPIPFEDVKSPQDRYNQVRPMPSVGRQSVMSFQSLHSPKMPFGYDNQGFAC